MVNLFMIVGISVGLGILGFGAAYFLYVFTRPKKEIWSARIFSVSRSTMDDYEKGKPVSLKDLRVYKKDLLEKVLTSSGSVIYRLQGLNKTVPAVKPELVERWPGAKHPEVKVIFDGSSCTLLKPMYNIDAKTNRGELVYEPLPYERANMVQHEITARKERLRKEKDFLQAITPWITTIIAMMGLIGVVYIMVQGIIQVSDAQAEATRYHADQMVNASIHYEQAILSLTGGQRQVINQNQNINKEQDLIPSIGS